MRDCTLKLQHRRTCHDTDKGTDALASICLPPYRWNASSAEKSWYAIISSLICFAKLTVLQTEYYFPGEPFQPNLHLIFTTSLVISAMTVSLITCDLGVVFELVGATSACALAYILPPLCFINLTKRRTWETYAAYACIAFGCTVMTISLTLSIAKMARGEGQGMTCR